MTRLAGGDLARAIRAEVAAAAAALGAAGTIPRLAVVVATADEGSVWYVRSIAKSAAANGVSCEIVDLGADAAEAAIAHTLRRLSDDPAVHGIILQTPLPPGIPAARLASWIAVGKDVDGANPDSLGRLLAGEPAFAPATAEAVVALLDHHGVSLAGRDVTVVGRSTVVGKPVAALLLARDATVTICHSRTRDLAAHARRADVLVVAAGRARMVGVEHVTERSVVVDVGTNAEGDSLVGDVDADAVEPIVAGLSPVPGGVGPVTSALILQHTVLAAGSPPRTDPPGADQRLR